MNSAVEALINDFEASLAVAKKALQNAQDNAVRLRGKLGLVSTGANQKNSAVGEETLTAVITKRRKNLAKQKPNMKVLAGKKKKIKAS